MLTTHSTPSTDRKSVLILHVVFFVNRYSNILFVMFIVFLVCFILSVHRCSFCGISVIVICSKYTTQTQNRKRSRTLDKTESRTQNKSIRLFVKFHLSRVFFSVGHIKKKLHAKIVHFFFGVLFQNRIGYLKMLIFDCVISMSLL